MSNDDRSDSPLIPVSSMADLVQEVTRFRPRDVLAQCRAYYLQWMQDRTRPLRIDVAAHLDRHGMARTIQTGPFAFALIARLSLVAGHNLAPGELTRDAFIRILRITSEVYEKIEPRNLLRLSGYEQGWYQRRIRRAITRSLALYGRAPLTRGRQPIDIPNALQQELGLPFADFAALSFLLFALMTDVKTAPFQHLTTIRPKDVNSYVRNLLQPDSVRAFLANTSADQASYRGRAQAESIDGTGLGRYDYNPLFEAPIIEMPPAGFTIPIPELLIWQIETAPMYRIREHFRGTRHEGAVSEFLGKTFERYVGELLEDAFGNDKLIPEQEYPIPGGSERGPDWIVLLGSSGIAIESLLGTIPVSAHTDPGGTRFAEVLKDRYAWDITRLPDKIARLTDARPELGLDAVKKWHRILVYKEPLHFNQYLREELLDPWISDDAKPYHLASIEELEDLLALEGQRSVLRTLEKKEAEDPVSDLRDYIGRIGRANALDFTCARLKPIETEFFESLGFPESRA